MEGERLDQYIGAGFDFLFHANAGVRPLLHFDRSVATQGPKREPASDLTKVAAAEETAPSMAIAATRSSSEERNGASTH